MKWKTLNTGLSGTEAEYPSMWIDPYGVIHCAWTISGEIRFSRFIGIDWETSDSKVSDLKNNRLFKSCITIDEDRYPAIVYGNEGDIFVSKWNGTYWEDKYGGPIPSAPSSSESSESSSESIQKGLGATINGLNGLKVFVCRNGILSCYKFISNEWVLAGSLDIPFHDNTEYDLSAFKVGEDYYLFWKMSQSQNEWIGHCIYDTDGEFFKGNEDYDIKSSKGEGYLSLDSAVTAKLVPLSSNLFYKTTDIVPLESSSSSSSISNLVESPEPFIYEDLSTPFLYEDIGGGNARITGYSATVPTNFIIPDTMGGLIVTKIGANAFNGACQSMVNLTIANSIENIEAFAFYECYNLTGLTLGTGLLDIGENAFGGCTSLSNLVIPDNVTELGNLAFVNCDALTNLTLGNSLISIGEGTFGYCQALISLTIPSSVESIGTECFYGCDSLNEVVFDGDAPIVGSDVFADYPISFKVRFYDGHGFTLPTWSGYPSECIDC